MRLLGGPASEWTRRDLVFVTKSGYPVEPRNLARSFERIIGHAKLRHIRLHDLRHTTATLLKDLGVPVRDTMEILGHSRIAVTLEIYTGADDASRLEAIERLNRLLEGRLA
jgi:integrase